MAAMTEEELWNELVDEAGEDLIEEAASVSVADAEAYLRAHGYDVDAERARAEAFLRSLEGEAGSEASARAVPVEGAPAPVVPSPAKPKTRRPYVAWAVATAAVAAGAATLYVQTRPPLVAQPYNPSAEDLAAAAELRHRATVACSEGRPVECLSLLDQARAKDPAGDADPAVSRLRARAERDLPGR